MSEIGNYYNAYRRAQRERSSAFQGLEKAKQQERERERLVQRGMLRKTVTYDPAQRLTTIHYEKVERDRTDERMRRLQARDVEYDDLES